MEASSTRRLVDTLFSLQWCRENIVIPLGIGKGTQGRRDHAVIAVGNFSYLATIGDFIEKRVSNEGFDCQFVQRSPEEIHSLLDQAASERLISGETLDSFSFTDDSVLEALRAAGGDSSEDSFRFDFDDSEEEDIEETSLDLSVEMLGSQIQRAAAQRMPE